MFATIISLANTFQVNDWFLSVVILTLLLMLIIMGSYRYEYIDSFSSMLRFKNPDGDVSYPLLSTVENIIVFVLSCVSIGIVVTIYSQDLTDEGFRQVIFLLWYSLSATVAFVLKLLLYSAANKILYQRQVITLKPGRWNCFFVMSFSVASFLILVFSILVLFLNLPRVLLLVFAYLMRILVISGRIFKIKTTLFKNQRSNSGFIMYLCAFEIAPVLVELVLLRYLFGLI
ncbi:MAG: DUF4271 domain-containing protein [Bacteroidaceae bacterium]|nr:DUF4271 domain-containing protein [Bacteroidaceae bacterium]